MGLSFWHLLILVLVVVLLFGAGKIPRLAKDLGIGIRAFRKGLSDTEEPAAGAGEPEPPRAITSGTSTAAREKDKAAQG